MRIRLYPLGVVHQTGKDDDAQDQEEDEEGQLLGRGPERLYEYFQARRVPRQLEQSHDAYDAEELEDVEVLQLRGKPLQRQVDVKAQRGDHVDDVHRALDEVAAVRTGRDAHEEFYCEPNVTDALYVKKRDMSVRVRLVHGPRGDAFVPYRFVREHGHPHVGVRFQAK